VYWLSFPWRYSVLYKCWWNTSGSNSNSRLLGTVALGSRGDRSTHSHGFTELLDTHGGAVLVDVLAPLREVDDLGPRWSTRKVSDLIIRSMNNVRREDEARREGRGW
jgi:hypothetical protein